MSGPQLGLYWAPHREKVWAPCTICGSADGATSFKTLEGEVVSCPTASLPSGGLAQVQDQQLEGVDDICALSTVTEAALLHTTRVRYSRRQIYTRVSRILIALNPFEVLPIYSTQCLREYARATDSLDLVPHIYGTGHDALRGLREGAKDQAIVISGESGAGKTESAKLLLKFVAEVVRSMASGDTSAASGEASPGHGSVAVGGIEEKVMQTNPVLEAFGNAMTTRNNNSSRFGKWLDLRFSSGIRMVGCRITSYLLEVTRVCSQQAGERGYHVFFQLLGASRSHLLQNLDLQEIGYYRYLKGSVPVAPGIDDNASFAEMREALLTLGFCEQEQLQIFRIVMGALSLGNCDFHSQEGANDAVQLQDAEPLQRVAALLQVEAAALERCMLWRKVVVGRAVGASPRKGAEVTMTPLREEHARAVRDGLSRALYGRLFEWLILRMNDRLEDVTCSASLEAGAEDRSTSAETDRLLGILDISGFESFLRNSLEQLLINLSNEHLQHQFNDDVFKAELEDCAKEGVTLENNIDYLDNSDVVALLDGRGGVLDMLDEDIAMPKATDLTFSAKIIRGHTSHPRFITPKFSGKAEFGVHHFAGDVNYSCDGFLEKNSDRLPSEDVVEVLLASQLAVLCDLGERLKEQTVAQGKRSKSATSRFRTSLKLLMAKISAADNHYVRCIKPNLEKLPQIFTAPMVHEQLLFSGVLEAVRIRQQGYSSRLIFRSFVIRYRCVIAIKVAGIPRPQGFQCSSLDCCDEAAAKLLVIQLRSVCSPSITERDIVFGTTKVFMKSSAMTVVEAARARAFQAAVLYIQRLLRGHRILRRFALAKPLACEICTWVRARCPGPAAQTVRSKVVLLLPTDTFEFVERELSYVRNLLSRASELPLHFGIVNQAVLIWDRLWREVCALRRMQRILRGVRVRWRFALAAPILFEIRRWLTSWCPEGPWQSNQFQKSLFERCGSFEIAERELASITLQLRDNCQLSDSFGIVQRADKMRAKLSEEVEALRRVRELLHCSSVDLAAMGAALAGVQSLLLPHTPDVLALASRANAVQIQLPLVDSLREIVNSGSLAALPHILPEIARVGLLANRDGWIAELGGLQLFNRALQIIELEEARQRQEAEEARQRQEAEEARQRQEAEEAFQRQAAEDARKQKEAEEIRQRQEEGRLRQEEEARLRQEADELRQRSAAMSRSEAQDAQDRPEVAAAQDVQLHHGVDAPPVLTSKERPRDGDHPVLVATKTVAEAPKESSSSTNSATTSAARSMGHCSAPISTTQLAHLAQRLSSAGERLSGVALGQQLTDASTILQELADCEVVDDAEDAMREKLIELAAQVSGIGERIRGVPLGRELAEIADLINTEATEGSNNSVNNHILAAAMHASPEELRHTVARLMEEKQELRNALQASLLEAVEEIEQLKASNKSLHHCMDSSSLPEEVQAMLEEEARAARAARANLVSEVTRLRTELAAEQVSSRALRAELAAVRALQSKGIKLNGTSVKFPTTLHDPAKEPDVTSNVSHINGTGKHEVFQAAGDIGKEDSREASNAIGKSALKSRRHSLKEKAIVPEARSRSTSRSVAFAMRDFVAFESDAKKDLATTDVPNDDPEAQPPAPTENSNVQGHAETEVHDSNADEHLERAAAHCEAMVPQLPTHAHLAPSVPQPVTLQGSSHIPTIAAMPCSGGQWIADPARTGAVNTVSVLTNVGLLGQASDGSGRLDQAPHHLEVGQVDPGGFMVV